MARFSERQQSVTALHLMEASIPNSVYPMNNYARMLEFTDAADNRYFIVFPTKLYADIGAASDTIINAFASIPTSNPTATQASNINDMFTTVDNSGTTTLFTITGPNPVTSMTLPTMTYNSDTIKIDLGGSSTVTFLSYNSAGVQGGQYLCNDLFGISGTVGASATSFPDGVNINPIDNLYLRLSSSNYDYFSNVECLTDEITDSGAVVPGTRCFASVPMNANFGEVVYFHPNSEHNAGYKLNFPARSIDSLVVEWLQYRNGQLSPVNFNGVNNTLLLDVFSSFDRARPKCY
ncbi:MAG: hypothetical protein CMM25_05940 [Rhodospirillaceae bacterium]|nr:hypothetical protein [Rhodospirillaceae bacterium]